MTCTTPAERGRDNVSNYMRDGQVYLRGGAACTTQNA